MPTPAWIEVRRRVALAGTVTEHGSRSPIAGARVEISTGPAAFEAMRLLRPDLASTSSASDGHFYFLDLPGGTYTVTATVPAGGGRYGVGKDRARIRVSAEGVPETGRFEIEVPSTRIEGRVLAADGSPVRRAEVRLGSGLGLAVTDAEGRFALPSVELGPRVLTVSARGFKPAQTEVRVTGAGKAKTVTVKLATRSA